MSRYFVHCPLNFAKKQLNIDHHVCLNFSQNCLCHSHCLWHPIAISQKCEGGMRMSNWACSIRASPAVSKTLMRARMKLLLLRVKYIEDESIKSKMKMKVFQDADDDESIVGVRVNAPFLWVGSHALPLWTLNQHYFKILILKKILVLIQLYTNSTQPVQQRTPIVNFAPTLAPKYWYSSAPAVHQQYSSSRAANYNCERCTNTSIL